MNKKRRLISATLMRLGIACRREFTTTFIPSFLEISLSGLNALKVLKPRINESPTGK
jgi:hypothetical protein